MNYATAAVLNNAPLNCGTIYACITHEHLGSSLAGAVITGIACNVGANVGQSIVKRLFPEMGQVKVSALENTKAAAKSIQQQEKQHIRAMLSPVEQNTAMKKTQAPVVAEANDLETRKTKVKIKTAGSKPKPKIPPKATESTKRYGLAESSFEQELDHVHSTTENLLLGARVRETLRDTRGGLRSHTLSEDDALKLDNDLSGPRAQAAERAVLWQHSMQGNAEPKLSSARGSNAARKPIYSVDNSHRTKSSNPIYADTHSIKSLAQNKSYNPITSELEGYANGTKNIYTEEGVLSSQHRRLQEALAAFEDNRLSAENYKFFSPVLEADYEKAYENNIERRNYLEAEYIKMQQLPKSAFAVWDKSPAGTEFSKLLSIKGGIANIDNELQTYVREDLKLHLTSVKSKLSLNYTLQQRQERLRTGTELPWYREYAETLQMMTGVYIGASWTIASGVMERHPGLAFGTMALTLEARSSLTLGGLALYGGLSTAPAENLLRRGADYGLEGIGFDNPYTRDLLSTPTVEAFKMGLTWGAVKATPPVLRIGGQLLKPSIAAVRSFVAERTFRSPITLQYDSAKLYSGLPIDIFKPQKPWIKKDVLSESAKLHPSPLLEHEVAIIEQWAIERVNLLEKWKRQDISEVNEKAYDLLTKCHKQLRDRMTPNDLAAIIKEQRGIKIPKQEGGAFDHIINEWRQVQDSFENAFNGPWSGSSAEVQILNKRFGDLSRLWNRFEKLMERAKCSSEAITLKN